MLACVSLRRYRPARGIEGTSLYSVDHQSDKAEAEPDATGLAAAAREQVRSVSQFKDDTIAMVVGTRDKPLMVRLAVGILLLLAALAFWQLALWDLADRHLYLTLFPPIILAAVLGRFASGALVTLLAATAAFFALPSHPRMTDWMGLATFVASGIVVAAAAQVLHTVIARLTSADSAKERLMTKLWLAAIVDTTADAVVGFDVDGRVVSWNKAAEALFGYTAEEAKGRDARLVSPPAGAPGHSTSACTAFIEAMRHGRFQRDAWCHAKDGSSVEVSVTATEVRAPDGTLLGVSAIMRDIRKRRAQEEALRSSREDLNRAQALAHIGSWRMSAEGRELRWSVENHQIFGVPAGTAMSLDSFLAAVHPDDRDYVDQSWKEALAGAAYDIEHRIVVDGRTRWVRERAELEFDANGQMVGGFGTTQDITEKKDAEAKLRKSEESLRFALASARAAVWQLDLASRRPDWSADSLELHGLAPNDSPPGYDEWISRIHLDDRGRIAEEIARLLRSDATQFELELRVDVQGKGIRWLSLPGRVERAGGEPVRLVGLNIDVTERKEAEAALAASEERLAAVVNSTMDAIVLADRDHRIRLFNPAAERLFGLAAAQAIGMPVEALVAPRYRDRFTREIVAVAERADGSATERFGDLTGQRANSDEFPIEISISRSAVGGAATLTAVFRDVTERRLAEAAIRDSEQQLRLSNEAADIGTFLADIATGNIKLSPQAASMAGFSGKLSTKLTDVFARVHRDDRDYVERQYHAALDPSGSGKLRIEVRFVRPGGEVRWMTWNGRVEFSGSGFDRAPKRILGACVDTTDRKLALEALAAANDELERRVAERTAALEMEMQQRQNAQAALVHSQRLEGLGRLAGGLTHDFNNTLAAIASNLGIAQSRINDKIASDCVEKALDAVEIGASLNRRLLSFTRRDNRSRQIVDPARRIRAVSDLLLRTIGTDIRVSVDIGDKLWATELDPGELESAILNLAINARDAMPNGGDLTFVARNVVLTPATRPAATPVAHGDYVCLTVSDTGTGMTPEVLKRAGEPFFTTKGSAAGTGLGLSSINQFVRNSEGFMTIESSLGAGTTVSLYLKRAAGEAVQNPPAPERSHVPLGDGETVLLVDDDERVLEATHALLEGLGYSVIPTRSAGEAIGVLRRGENVDAVLSDVVMPGGMSGHDLARIAKRDWPALPVILATGYDSASPKSGTNRHEIAVLRKPYSRAELATTLQTALQSAQAA